eukprot:1159475-Pelagomonas_calceolata.AAC.2
MQRTLRQPSAISNAKSDVRARAAAARGPTHLSRRKLFGASLGLFTAMHQPGHADAKQLIGRSMQAFLRSQLREADHP